MHGAQRDELKTHAYPVLTAQVSDTELSKWFPIPLQHITDPEEAPEPSKAGLVRLDHGEYFVIFHGELSRQLTVRIPQETDATAFLRSFLTEVPLPPERILWRRDDAALPETEASLAGQHTKSG
jgi:hypothetical protein